MGNDILMTVKGLHKRFGDNEVLKGVDITVRKGDVTVILGPSGSGKTTLLRCINFLEKSDEGELNFSDTVLQLKHASKRDIYKIRQKTAFVFQNYNLFANKTAIENVMEGLVTARKIKKNKAYEIAAGALDKVGLADRYNYYPSQLSGGQQQRVGIARAIAVNPEIIFFDEPTSALDPELIGEVLEVMKELAKEDVTMLIVTHEMKFAQEVASNVIFMDGGYVIEQGEPAEIFSKPKEERTRQFLRRIIQDFDYVI